MADPLTTTEIASLSRGVQQTPWHLVAIDMLEPPAPRAQLGIEELTARVADRLPFAPRFRQRIRETVTGLDWVDDEQFDLDRHLIRHTMEESATLGQVSDLVAEMLGRPLDPARPQWDLTLVDGFRGGWVALVSRVHPAYVDGTENVHLLQELYDDEVISDVPVPRPWTPAPAPEVGDDLVSGVMGGLKDPVGLFGRLSSRVVRTVTQGVEWAQDQGLPSLLRPGEPVAPSTRYVGLGQVSLDAVNRVRDGLGCTTHDVLVALVTSGLRQWQTQLGAEPTDIVALVPLAVRERGSVPTSVGCQVAAQYVTLPVKTPSPQGRIDQIASLTRSRIDSGHTVGGDRLTRIAGFGPATLHALSARTVTGGRAHDVFVSNAPGPRSDRYLGEWRLSTSYPAIGLADSEDVSVCLTSYAGTIGIGIVAAAPVTALVDGITSELNRLDGGRR